MFWRMLALMRLIHCQMHFCELINVNLCELLPGPYAQSHMLHVQSHMFKCAATYVYMCGHISLHVQSHMFTCAVTCVARSYF